MRRLIYLWSAACCSLASPLSAACDASNTYSYNFNNAATTPLNYANTYNYTATNGLGATQSFNVKFIANGVTASVNVNNTNYVTPRIDNAVIGSETGTKTLTLGGSFSARTTSITSGTRTVSTTFTFAVPIRDFTMVVHDVDYNADQYRDWIHVSGNNGSSTFSPSMTGPFGNNNSGTSTAAGSTLAFGPTTTTNPALSVNEARGVGASDNSGSSSGNITASFAQPVTSITIRYGNFPLSGFETQTGQQAIGISRLTFCPMPTITVVKSSAPTGGSGAAAFATPGSDMTYTLTVTNSGGSPVDASTIILTDPLPSNVVFYNGDFDPAAAGMGPVQTTSSNGGITLPASGIQFSSNGTTWSNTAPAGYSPTIRHIRLTPSGSLAANNSLTLRFRVRID